MPSHLLPGALAQVGRRGEAHAVLKELEQRHAAGQRFPCTEAFVGSFYLNDRMMTRRWLECAIEQREVFPRLYSAEFAELWQEPEFQSARQQIGQPMIGAATTAGVRPGAMP